MASPADGTPFWRSLDERADTEAFRSLLENEFPAAADEWTDPVSRRRFLSLMGAGLALAGLAGCSSAPREKILPYVRQPEQIVPGKPLFFATAMTVGGYATGLLVESHLGRPIKVEGNPEHPASLGATDAIAQASVLGVYDPDRSRGVTYTGRPATWERAFGTLRGLVERLQKKQGEGLRILTGTITSPTLGGQLLGLLKTFPQARWHQYEAIHQDAVLAGAQLAFAEPVAVIPHFERADVVVSLDDDFLGYGPGQLRAAHDFAARRNVWDHKDRIPSRLYVVESTLSLTGAKADHRLPLQAHKVESFSRALALEVVRLLRVRQGGSEEALNSLESLTKAGPRQSESPEAEARRWAAAVARDLTAKDRIGKTLIVAGEGQPPAVHALAHLLNVVLGNTGKTIAYIEPVEVRPENQTESLRQLTLDMDAGKVEALLILGSNPVYDAPADLEFGRRMAKVPLRFHLGLYQDETARLCHWHVPEAHYLETWSDARAFEGTASVVQPLIAPLYEEARSAHEILAALTDEPSLSGHELVRAHWRRYFGERKLSGSFEAFWEKCLHDGMVPGTMRATKSVQPRRSWPADDAKEWGDRVATPSGLEIVFRPDPGVFDGRFANNGWLQELPRPLTQLTWDNAALMSPETARRLGIGQGRGGYRPDLHAPLTEVVTLRLPGRDSVEAGAWILPGLPDDTVTVHLGLGRTHAGSIGTGVGFNGYRLRTSSASWFEAGLQVTRTGHQTQLASAQHHHLMENKSLVRTGTTDGKLTSLGEHGTGEEGRHPLSLHPAHEYTGHRWGMVIDLTSCIGCGACVIACQAENNIPIVGKDQVLRGREMHWIRVDRYFAGEPEQPKVHFQPVPCMHCENAPCELVCPVAATVHSDEGLNDMVYNRCVGTRYCSNNCPYKVRRFNFLQYTDRETETLKLMRNPDVTVRTRGVMEKCTYCVQRINGARIAAEKAGRRVEDGEVVTACQAVCPAEAILFGDTNDSKSVIARAKKSPLNYGLLEELNTRPRTTYLAEVRNINPDPDLNLGTA